MDPFQLRIECLGLVRRLTASQQSIAKVVEFLAKHAVVAADDMWDCILGECEKTSLNARLNILFLIDALVLSAVDPSGISSSSAAAAKPPFDASASSSAAAHSSVSVSTYSQRAVRDVRRIVDAIVPDNDWDAVRLNASSTQKVLASWSLLGILPMDECNRLTQQLQDRKVALSHLASVPKIALSKQDVLRRIEEDRERHKRLRERAWILPAKTYAQCLQPRQAKSSIKPSPSSPVRAALLDRRGPKSSAGSGSSASVAAARAPDAVDIDFEQMWETTSDLNEDDFEQMREQDAIWWGGETFAELQQERARLLHEHSLAASREGGMSMDNEALEASPLEQETEERPSKRMAADTTRGHDGNDEYDGSRVDKREAHDRNRWRPIGGSQGRNGAFQPVQRNDGRDRDAQRHAHGYSRWPNDRDRASQRRDQSARTGSHGWR